MLDAVGKPTITNTTAHNRIKNLLLSENYNIELNIDSKD